jgi:two-component system response regulator NreC
VTRRSGVYDRVVDSSVSIVIADDHPLVRDGVKRLICDQPDMVVVGEAADSDAAIAETRRLLPCILLLDMSMPGAGGVAVAQTLAASCPRVKIIAVTRHTDNVFVTRMLAAGAAGYVLKQSLTSQLLGAIRAVAGGEQYVDSSLPHATGRLGEAAPQTKAGATRNCDESLSTIEERVLQLFGRAYSNHEIARQLRLASHDLSDIKSSALRKAGIATRADAAAYASRRGWS